MSCLVHIHYGVTINGILYVWHKKQLYKMPLFKPIKQQLFNTSNGYYINRKPYSLAKLKKLTEKIELTIKIKENLPF